MQRRKTNTRMFHGGSVLYLYNLLNSHTYASVANHLLPSPPIRPPWCAKWRSAALVVSSAGLLAQAAFL